MHTCTLSAAFRAHTTRQRYAWRRIGVHVRTIHQHFAWRRILRYLARINPRRYDLHDVGVWLDNIDDYAVTIPRRAWWSLKRRLGYEIVHVHTQYCGSRERSIGFTTSLIVWCVPMFMKLFLKLFGIPRPMIFAASMFCIGLYFYWNMKRHSDSISSILLTIVYLPISVIYCLYVLYFL